MSTSLFKRVINDAAELGINNIYILGYGEPLLDKRFAKQVAYCKSRGINFVGTSTNGLLLSEKVSKEIISAGLDFIHISVDAATSQTYQRIHGSSFQLLEKNIFRLKELKSEMKTQKPKIQVSFRVCDNKEELSMFMSKFRGVADSFEVGGLHSWGGRLGNMRPGSPRIRPCMHLWSSLQICWDGRVALCCIDTECSVPLGDLRVSSLFSIWNGRKLKEVRDIHRRAEFNKLPICIWCNA